MKQLTFKVEPGSNVTLPGCNPGYTADIPRNEADSQLDALTDELDDLQELLYAASIHSVLVIFQGMDTSGKDGVVRKVFSKVSPLGCHVSAFKVPTEEELAHDFLWRIHRRTPRHGEIGVFNRSHYEDVVVVRVHELVTKHVWQQRYGHINEFERMLTDNNTILLKFFLHISKEEQEKRLLAREKDVSKAWKLSPGDWKERERWDDYQTAYADALRECSTAYAPWYVVPADHKWFRNLAVAQTIVETLRPFREPWMTHLATVRQSVLPEVHTVRNNHTS